MSPIERFPVYVGMTTEEKKTVMQALQLASREHRRAATNEKAIADYPDWAAMHGRVSEEIDRIWEERFLGRVEAGEVKVHKSELLLLANAARNWMQSEEYANECRTDQVLSMESRDLDDVISRIEKIS